MRNLLTRIIKKSRFFKKMLIGMIIIAVVPTFLTVSIIYNTYSTRMINEISSANLKILGQIRIYFDAMLSDITSVALNNSTEKEMLFFSKNHFSEDAAEFNRISKKYSSMIETNSMFDSIFIYFDNFKYLVGAPIGSPSGFNYLENIKDMSWYDLYKKDESNGFILRDLPGNEKCLSLLRSIKDSTSNTQAVLVVSVSQRSIYNNINKLKTHSLENIYIFDSKGNFLFHIGEEKNPLILDTLKYLKYGEDSYFIKDFGNSRKVIASTISEKNGWRFVSVTDEKEIFKKISLFTNLTILIAFMAITASVVFSFLYGRYLYRPISNVIENMKSSISKDVVQGDELQVINKAFEDMVNIKNNLQNLIDENKNTMKDKLLNNILLGYDYNQNEINEKLEFFEISFEFNRFCVLLVKPKSLTLDNTNENQLKWKIYTLTLIEQLINDMDLKGLVFETNFENLAVLLNIADTDHEEIKTLLKNFCNNLQSSLAMTTLLRLSIGVGNVADGLEQISESYQQAAKALDYSRFTGRNGTVFINEILHSVQINMQIDKYEKKLDVLIQNKDKEGLNNLVDDIVNEVILAQSMSHVNIINFFSIILSYSLKVIERINAKAYKKYLEKPIFTDFLKNESLEDMGKWLQMLYSGVIDDLNDLNDRKNGFRKIHKAEQYIMENYNTDLTLTIVAEKVGMNPNYLSNIFKEETGKNFIDYINLLRVEKSKELLQSTSLNITEIALKVGFTNDRSLTRSFKKYEGCTPGLFREAVTLEKY